MYPAVLIEDSATIRDTLIPTLAELADIEVLAFAETEDDGVRLMAAEGAHARLVILDLFLGEGTGIGVLKRCPRMVEDKCVVVLTNHATRDMRQRCANLGAQALFDKSTQLDEFFEYCRGLPQTCQAGNVDRTGAGDAVPRLVG